MRHVRNINTPAAVLWASAFVIAALIVIQAGRLPQNSAGSMTDAEMGGRGDAGRFECGVRSAECGILSAL